MPPRIQLRNISAPGLAVEDKLAHELAGGGAVLDAPARVARCDPEAADGRGADEGRALAAEAHVARQVACLPGGDAGGGERGADGADIRDEVVALGVITLDEVCGGGERHSRVGLAARVHLAAGARVDLRVHVAAVAPALAARRPVRRHPVRRQRDVREDGVRADVRGEHNAVRPQALHLGPRPQLARPRPRGDYDVRHALDRLRPARHAVEVLHVRDGRLGLVQADPRDLGVESHFGAAFAG